MKAIWYEKPGSAAGVLQFGDVDTPEPQAGEVRVKLKYSGVNPIDVKKRQGGRGGIEAPRIIPHFDGSGIIDAVAEDVDSSRQGQRVWVYGAQWQRDFGTAAQYVTVPADCAVPLPEGTSFEEGACLGIPALTAYYAMFADGKVEGQTLLVTGGAGAVGRYAVQFGKLSGARVITTVSSDEKAAIAHSAGADEILNYRDEDVGQRMMELTDGRGVDRIVEVEFGGNLQASLASIKTGGTIASYASQAVPEPTLPFYEIMYKGLTLRHILVFLMPDELMKQAIQDITKWLEADRLTYQIAKAFPLDETAAAHEYQENGPTGKVLVSLSS